MGQFFLVLIMISLLLLQTMPTPEGKLAYVCLTDDGWQVWAGPLNGEVRQLTTTAVDKKRPRWSNDGEHLVYQTNNGEIFIIAADGTGEHQIAIELGVATDPIWSNDDSALYLSVFRSGTREDSEIWRFPFNGDAPERFTSEIGLQYNPSPSPDGQWFVYTSGAGETTHELWRYQLENASLLQLTDNLAFDLLPRWSPNGEWIIYATDQGESYDIWRIEPDGSNPVQLTSEPGLENGPVWSPDGKWIAFESNHGGTVQVWVMPAEGGEMSRVSPAQMTCRNVDWGHE